MTPLRRVLIPDAIESVVEAGKRLVRGLLGVAAQTQRKDECAARRVEIDLADESDVAVIRPVEAPRHLLVRPKILPAVGTPDESCGSLQPGGRARQRHGDAMT